MRLVLISGTHSRHLFVNRVLLEHFDSVLVIIMQEDMLPAPSYCSRTKSFFLSILIIVIRLKKVYGELSVETVFEGYKKIFVSKDRLNSIEVIRAVSEFSADFAFIFGVDIIHDRLMSVLPEYKMNLHLGLSPWFRGCATLFWPFYLLKPQYAGVTFHQISKSVDAGSIVHQSVPKMALETQFMTLVQNVCVTGSTRYKFNFKVLEKKSFYSYNQTTKLR